MAALIPLAEVAQRLGVSVKTVKRRLAEAGIKGPRPGHGMLLTEADFARLVEAMRARRRPYTKKGETREQPPRDAGEALRAAHLRQTKRLLGGMRRGARPVVALDLERR